jgi:2-polyprenyl-6-methoxyphenol hydroxylase-like FAD-dependent oxidoreductase
LKSRHVAGAGGGSGDVIQADVAIVGYGPVGQCAALLLARAGHQVVVCERRAGLYETPRAGHFDHEIMRALQSLGLSDRISEIADPARLYQFLDADGALVSELPRDWKAPSGWDASYHFYQPELEAILNDAVIRLPNIDLRMGNGVADLRQADGKVDLVLEDGTVVRARFAIGADGANSAVRQLCAVPSEDLGFRGDWLVVDVRPRPGAVFPAVADTCQVLNPARPNHIGRVAERYYRWEFMLVEGEDPADMVRPETVWALLEPWIGPDDGELIRQTVYQFRSIVAEDFRAGRVFLAGDSAHRMPPFLGQGMCSGIRDAVTLSWMLDLVLTDRARPELLDVYTASRRPHVVSYIEESVRIGRVVCETDPIRSAERREALRTAKGLPDPFQPPVGAGFRAGDALAGYLAVQPRLGDLGGVIMKSDDVLGVGFTLFSLEPLDAAAAGLAAQLHDSIGLRCVDLSGGQYVDADNALSDWLSTANAVAVVVRPDFYVYGSCTAPAAVAQLLEDLAVDFTLAAGG